MEEKIIKEYLKGKSISSLLFDYPTYNRRQITKILKDNGVTIRGGRKKKMLSDEQITEIKKMIDDGAFLIEIASYCKLSKETMRIRLNDLGLKIKNTNRINRHIKSNYFSVIDAPEKAYWLGFLYTDGAVDHYRATGRIRLQLQEQDKEILEQFKKDLGIESKIIYNTRPNSTCCSVEFTDEQIFNDLAKYDIIPNKTYKIDHIPYKAIPKEYLKDFVLGLFDGDGGLSLNTNAPNDVTLSYTAYYETEVKDFQFLINSLANIQKDLKNYYTEAWRTQWRGRLQVLKILDILYKDSPRYLKRKYAKYITLKNSLK